MADGGLGRQLHPRATLCAASAIFRRSGNCALPSSYAQSARRHDRGFWQVERWTLIEPDDKAAVQGGYIYLAPADYHLLVEAEGYFSLSVEEPVHYSRPSIDVLFESVVRARWPYAGAALLSGANRDGASGLHLMHQAGYFTAVQDITDAEIPTMPQAALDLFEPNRRFRAAELVQVFLHAVSLYQ